MVVTAKRQIKAIIHFGTLEELLVFIITSLSVTGA